MLIVDEKTIIEPANHTVNMLVKVKWVRAKLMARLIGKGDRT